MNEIKNILFLSHKIMENNDFMETKSDIFILFAHIFIFKEFREQN